MIRSPKRLWGYIAVAVWISFTVSLTAWWIYFGVTTLRAIQALEHTEAAHMVGYQRMLLYEGGTLILSLVGAAIALFWLITRERRERMRTEEFFATLTHELKTPLAGIQLQAELLSEAGKDKPELDVTVRRLLTSVAKLSLRIENALAVATVFRTNPYREKTSLEKIVANVRSSWPELSIVVEADAGFEADIRAMESIFNNLFQNALTHGGATEVRLRASRDEKTHITVSNNGRGFEGNTGTLGKLFVRHYPGSGTGIGLYLVRALVRKMGGGVRFLPGKSDFAVELWLP